MKKTIYFITLFAVLLTALVFNASAKIIADGTCGKNAIWELDDQGTLTVSGSGKMTDYSTWRSIPYHTNDDKITEVVIEEGITSIGDYSFYHHAKIESVSLPNTLERIGRKAFEGCRGIKRIVLPNSVKIIEYEAFGSCSNLTDISLPDSISYIGRWAFNLTGYYSDKSNWDGDLLYIDNHLVEAADGIQGEMVIRDGTLGLADDLFFFCSGINSMSLPASLKYISGNPFGGKYYKRFMVHPDNQYFSVDEYGILFDKEKSVLYFYPNSCGLEKYIMPDSVETVNSYAFWNSNELEKIDFSKNLRNIGKSAFGHCDGVTEFFIHDTLETVGKYAFTSCRRLENIYFEGNENEWYRCLDLDDPSDVDTYLFYDSSIKMHFNCNLDKETEIYAAKFKYPANNQVVTVSHDMMLSFKDTISGCSYKLSVIDESSGDYIFEDISVPATGFKCGFFNYEKKYTLILTTFYESKKVGEDVIHITTAKEQEEPDDDLRGGGTTSEVVDDRIKNVKVNLFEQIGRDYINIRLEYGEPSKVAYHLNGASYYFEKEKTYIGFYNYLKNYGEDYIIYKDEEFFEEPYPFEKAQRVSVMVKDLFLNLLKNTYSVYEFSEHIGVNVKSEYSDFSNNHMHSFYYGGMLFTIENYSSDTISINDWCDIYAVCSDYDDESKDYTKLVGSTGIVNNYDIDSLDKYGIFTYKSGTIFKVDPNATGEVVVPNKINGTVINNIHREAFKGCDKITKIVMPHDVVIICDGTFENMTSLEEIELPINLRFIGKNAFKGCTGLKEIDIPFKTQNIAEHAFEGCTGLVTVKVPASVKKTGSHVFSGCTALENLLFEAEILAGGSYAFKNCSNLKNVIFGSRGTSVNHLSIRSRLGNAYAEVEANVKNMMILSNMSGKIDTEHTIMSNVEDIFYPYAYTFTFDDCKNSTIHYNYDPYGFPLLYEFLDNYDSVKIALNDKLVLSDTPPIIENGRTLVPVRAVLEQLGMYVEWDDTTKTVIAKGDYTVIQLPIGQNFAYVNGVEKTLDVPSKIVDGRTLVPIRFVSEAIGGTVNWISEKKIVDIKYKSLRNNSIDVTDFSDTSDIKLSNYGVIENISINSTADYDIVEFDYINYLHIPMQIMVYDEQNMIVDSRVTKSVWADLSFLTEFKKTLSDGKYLYDIMTTDKTINDTDLPRNQEITSFKGSSAIHVPKNGYISVMFPAKGTDAYTMMNVIMLIRTVHLAMELDGTIMQNVSDGNIKVSELITVLENVDWNTLIKCDDYERMKQIVDDFDITLYEQIFNPQSLNDFVSGLKGVFLNSQTIDLLGYCTKNINLPGSIGKLTEKYINSVLVDATESIIPFFGYLMDFVEYSNILSQLESMYDYSKMIGELTAAETVRFAI